MATATEEKTNRVPREEIIKAAIEKLVKDFTSGNIVGDMVDIIGINNGSPSNKWSMWNRLIMHSYRTSDARGYNQWLAVNRKVKPGTRCFYIYVPNLRVKKVKNAQGVEEEKKVLVGFLHAPVFRYEDTEGDPLPDTEPTVMPPLMDVATKWGLNIKYENFLGYALGSYNTSNKTEITLRTHDAHVFFHELSHASDDRLHGVKGGQDPIQEAVAEMSAAILCRLFLKDNYDRNAYDYIKYYATAASEKPEEIIMKIVNRVGKVVREIVANTSEAIESDGSVGAGAGKKAAKKTTKKTKKAA